MADLSQKALNVADLGVTLADKFLDAVEGLELLLSVAVDSGVNMESFDANLATLDSLKHVDGATFNRLAIAIPKIVTAIDAANSGGAGVTIRQLCNQLRSGK